MTDSHALGAVFTRAWVVEWMLDLVGYRASERLYEKVLLEPACGVGAFLLPAIDRLIASAQEGGVRLEACGSAIRAYDLYEPAVDVARASVSERLHQAGLTVEAARDLAFEWVRVGDFLLDADVPRADVVIGNPPYVRLEEIPAELAARYRTLWPTMRGRADLYIGFYERGLHSLTAGGHLAFICADRWMRNSYGRGLREFITADEFAVESLIRLHGVGCFEDVVSAYPAITVLRRSEQGPVSVLEASSAFGPQDVGPATKALRQGGTGPTFAASTVERWYGSDIWPEGSPDELSKLARYEERHEPLEDVLRQTRVGIGVATGADELFISTRDDVAEASRMLPLVMASHIASGALEWTPTYLVNPWDQDGLVNLAEYPLLRAYYESHRDRIAGRHTATKSPNNWYRTIDRVNLWLATSPKILLADMKARMTPVVERGEYYPHHNLYWITSVRWDIDVLAGLLLSDQAELFIRAYCVKMRGGTLRMQAQYLRRIRLPDPRSLSRDQEAELRAASASGDRERASRVARVLYGD